MPYHAMMALACESPISHPGSRTKGNGHGKLPAPRARPPRPCSARWPPSRSRPVSRPRRAGRPAAVLERRRGEAGDPRLRRRGHHRGRPELRHARRPHRHLRPGRHHLGRAAALRPGPVRARPAGRDGARAPRVEGDRAVQVGADRRPRRDGEVHREGLDGDRRRHPCRHEHRPTSRRSSPTGCRSRTTRSSSARSPSSSTSRCSR